MAQQGTRKSHKSRKTEPTEPVNPESSSVPVSGPSSTALAIQQPSDPRLSVLDATKLGKDVQTKEDRKDGAGNSTGVPAPVEPGKQWWYRPADSKARKVVEKILVMDAAGRPDKDIAKRLKTTVGSVQQYRYLGRKNGWIRENDEGVEESVDVEAELAMTVDRKIVRNIDASLDGQMTNWQTHEMTIAAAKGRGIFKSGETKADGPQTLPIVAIQVVMPPLGAGDQLPEVHEDQMGGTPAYIDGETETP